MRRMDIYVGKIYTNKGKGKTRRRVLRIGDDVRPKKFFSHLPPPDEPGVEYEQDGEVHSLYLSSFAGWAGRVIEEDDL
jgi:hypothetical protein